MCKLLVLSALALTAVAAVTAQAPLRVGVAGLSHGHVGWILGRPDRGDIEVVGIYEPDRALAERYAERFGFSMDLVYADLDAMLEATRPEAVTAFGSIYEHLAVVEAAAPRGIHVMVEKPLAVSPAHAQRMAALARQHGIHLLTNYETTWYGTTPALERLVHDERAVGDLRKLVAHHAHPGPQEIGVGPEFLAWLTDPVQNGGGALIDFGCYGANLITWLMRGERPVSVTAVTQQIKPDIYPEVDDEATIVLEYPEAQGIIQASWNWPFSRKDLEVYGRTGYAIADDATHLRVRRTAADEEETLTVDGRPAPFTDPFAFLVAVVRGTAEVGPYDLSSLENNLIVVDILDAARRSAAEGRRIELDAGTSPEEH